MLPKSLSGRIVGLGLLASIALITTAGLLLQTTDRTQSTFLLVGHNENVILRVNELVDDIREAESGQRGFLLTHSPVYLDTFNERIQSAQDLGATLRELTSTDPEQLPRAERLRRVTDAKIESLRKPLELAEGGRFDDALAFVASGRGRTLMEDLSRDADAIKASEESVLRLQFDEAKAQADWNHQLLLFGGPTGALLMVIGVGVLVLSFRRPLGALSRAIEALGRGDHSIRAVTDSGLIEIDRLARSYNVMADRLTQAIDLQRQSDGRLQEANEELRVRGNAVELLGGMAHRMQAARSDRELAEVLHCFLPQVLPNAPGALYVLNGKRDHLVRAAAWGMEATEAARSFAPDECWALRRGHSHFLERDGSDVCCSHVQTGRGYHCEPILAGGEVVGLLYLEGLVAAADRFRLAALTENVALALVNQRLQFGLREQSIRDPLTNLFNRRHMDDVLTTQIVAARHNAAGLTVAICDIDHFKRFNDQHGHEAGDSVIKAVADELQTHFGDDAIVCRHGGEEFAVIVPTDDVGAVAKRVEGFRTGLRRVALFHQGAALGCITVSVGITAYDPARDRNAAVMLRRADTALYRAKQNGRDRIEVDEAQPMLMAAE